jgi:hypothetical protein
VRTTAALLQGRNPALPREKTPPPPETAGVLLVRGSSERPGSIREALVRWLNEEL